MMEYFQNGFILLIPIFIWNIVFMKALPRPYQKDVFWRDISPVIRYPEQVLRTVIFTLPIFTTWSIETITQRIGIVLYIVGITVYFSSWIVQIYLPDCRWSKSIFGFMAPAYTSIIWLIGVGLVAEHGFLIIPYLSQVYLAFSMSFVIVHSLHSYTVYMRF